VAIKLGGFSQLRHPEDQTKDFEVLDFLELARELRLDAVDFHLAKGFASTDKGYLSRVKAKCVRYGLPIGYVTSGLFIGGPEEEAAAKVAQAKADVDVAAFLGAPMTHLYARGGEAAASTPGYEQGWAQIVRRCREVADYAAGKGVIVGVQNHDGGSWVAVPKTINRILKDVDRSNFVLILDTGQWTDGIMTKPRGVPKNANPNINEEYIAQTVHHARNVRAKIFNLDSGSDPYLDYGRIAGILRDAGYNGTVSLVMNPDESRLTDVELMRRSAALVRKCFNR